MHVSVVDRGCGVEATSFLNISLYGPSRIVRSVQYVCFFKIQNIADIYYINKAVRELHA